MVENMLVSIIIPVYNVEKYLSRCIESVLAQSYKKLEVILIDDGSTDNSGKICDKFAAIDHRIKVIHKQNEGLSAARNTGYLNAIGSYIFYLDSDDYIAQNCIERLIESAQSNDAEIAITRMAYIPEKENQEIEFKEKEYTVVLNAESAIEESLYQRLYSCCAPAKLYKKEVIEGILFPVGRLSEDLATCHLFLDRAKKVVFINAIGYYYRQHANSIMHIFNPKRMDALEWATSIEEFCKVNYPHIQSAAICRTFNVATHLLLDLPDSGPIHDKYYNDIWKEIKRTRKKTIMCTKVRFREKAAALLSYGGEKIMKKVWNSTLAVNRGRG